MTGWVCKKCEGNGTTVVVTVVRSDVVMNRDVTELQWDCRTCGAMGTAINDIPIAAIPTDFKWEK